MLPISQCNTVGFRIILGIALLLTTILAITPQPEAITPVMNDKVAHALAFVILAFLVDASWPALPFDWRKGLPLIGYGILLECLQYFVPSRFFSVADMVADTAGIGIYLLLSFILLQFWFNKNNHLGH